MKRIELILVRRGEDCFFSNPNTKSENVFFQTKSEGVSQILELIKEDIISGVNALNLFIELMNIRDFPITESHFILQLDNDLSTLKAFMDSRTLIKNKALTEIEGKKIPTLMVCVNCGNHASIVFKNGTISNIPSKHSARESLEILHDRNDINLGQKILLLKQVDESSLPEMCKKELSQLN